MGSRYARCICDLLIKKYYLRHNMILLMTYSSFLWHIVLFEGLLGYSSFCLLLFPKTKKEKEKKKKKERKRKEKCINCTSSYNVSYVDLIFSRRISLENLCWTRSLCTLVKLARNRRILHCDAMNPVWKRVTLTNPSCTYQGARQNH